MNKFCIIANDKKVGAIALTKKIESYILSKNGQCFICQSADEKAGYVKIDDLPDWVECVLVIGGDGTFLQAARLLNGRDLPILGINMGSLGFLTMTEAGDVFKAIDSILKNEYTIDYRMQLDVSAEGLPTEIALNDVVISRGGYSHLVGITVTVNGKVFGFYEGDGLIISTPTGSTGYNLSAGGPIITPGVNVMVITPICPHALNAQSFVVSGDDEVVVSIGGVRHKDSEDGYVTIDGLAYGTLKQGEKIVIKKASKKCKMCLTEDVSFIDTLNAKIK